MKSPKLSKEELIKEAKQALLNEEKTINSKQVEDSIDPGSDDVDQIQAKILALIASKLSGRDKENLQKIKNALKKIEENKFGICESCGEDIEQKRLLFNPKFINCISCAEELEIMAQRNGRL